jgi:hypothetical protein
MILFFHIIAVVVGTKGFRVANMYDFMEHPIVRCGKCGKETNFITIGKIKYPNKTRVQLQKQYWQQGGFRHY